MNGKELGEGVDDAILFVDWIWRTNGMLESCSGWCRLGRFVSSRQSTAAWERLASACKENVSLGADCERIMGPAFGLVMRMGFAASSRGGLTPLTSFPQLVVGAGASSWILSLRIECRPELPGEGRRKAGCAREELFAGLPMGKADVGRWPILKNVLAEGLAPAELVFAESEQLSQLVPEGSSERERGGRL